MAATAFEDTADPATFIPPLLEESGASSRFALLAAREANPSLAAVLREAAARKLPYLLDETRLTLGAGAGGRDFALDDLPSVQTAPWSALSDIPTALVTGSNGKTTTVRLIAACARAHGRSTAYSSTDGVFVDDEVLDPGDYSGPAGARLALRDHRARAAVLETARGGILRRGLAVSRAHVAVVTNVSADHFGEYGIYDLDGLADVKLTVAAVVPPDGMLVLNADDTRLRDKVNGPAGLSPPRFGSQAVLQVGEVANPSNATPLAKRLGQLPPLGWFALDADLPALVEHRARGGSTSGVRGGRLILSHAGADSDLGPIASMPLTVQGSATYNVGNLAAACLAATAMQIPASTIAAVFARFGANPFDNFGRMMQFEVNGVRVLLDYAHNSEGLRGLLAVAQTLRTGKSRLGLLLGHAGNRRDVQIEELARVAADFHPDLVVVKENEGQLRGREQGEVPRIIRAALLRFGLAESALPVRMSELEAARAALEWARPGDVLVLPVHAAAARTAVLELLGSHSP